MGGRDRPEPPEILTDPTARRIVVIGAGFGGLWAVRRFVSHEIGVTLIDRNNYHTFFPLLPPRLREYARVVSNGEVCRGSPDHGSWR